jgi:hypothetical protein
VRRSGNCGLNWATCRAGESSRTAETGVRRADKLSKTAKTKGLTTTDSASGPRTPFDARYFREYFRRQLGSTGGESTSLDVGSFPVRRRGVYLRCTPRGPSGNLL